MNKVERTGAMYPRSGYSTKRYISLMLADHVYVARTMLPLLAYTPAANFPCGLGPRRITNWVAGKVRKDLILALLSGTLRHHSWGLGLTPIPSR
jgi:hypothetical protein